MTLVAVDFSNLQGAVNLAQVAAAGVQVGICKATEGIGFQDAFFPANWAGMRTNGIARACYHMAHLDVNTPQAEAEYFLEYVGAPLPGDVPVLDFEYGMTSPGMADKVFTWLSIVQSAWGCPPVIYSNLNDLTVSGIGADPRFKPNGLWIAALGVTAPTLPADWSVWVAWQDSWSGTIPGITGVVDIDVINCATQAQFRLYGAPAAPTPTPDPLQAQLTAALQKIAAAQAALA